MIFAGFMCTLLYVGPGMSGGVVAVLIGILSAFVLSVIAIVWYPIKKTILFFKSLFKKSE
jgi:uncharacterized membrane protein